MDERSVVLETYSDKFPSSYLCCCIKNQYVDVFYNPTVGANLILDEFALAFLGDEVLVLTDRKLKRSTGSLVSSYGVIKNVSPRHDDVRVIMDFHVFEDLNFDFLIGYPTKAFLKDVLNSETLNIKIGKESYFVPITRSSSRADRGISHY